jgi:sortase A
MRRRFKNLFSYLLLAGGAFLLFLGAREYWGSRAGQTDGARDFQQEMQRADVYADSAHYSIRVEPPKPGQTFAKLLIPRLDTELYIVEGDDAADLRRAPGHLIGSALPGARGNCVIAGHRDTHFRVLKDIREGDDILLQTPHGEYLYRVQKTRVVSQKTTSVLDPTPDPELSLITCYPFYYIGSAPNRFVVEARLAGAVQPAS